MKPLPAKMHNMCDIGCHAEGGFGHEHVRAVLASIVSTTFPPQHLGTPPGDTIDRIVDALKGEMSDDAWEESDAIEVLNDLACDGVRFDFVDGDLMCLDADSEGES